MKTMMKSMGTPSVCLLLLAWSSAFLVVPPAMAAAPGARPTSVTERKVSPPQLTQGPQELEPSVANSTDQAVPPRTFSTSFQRMGNSQIPFLSVILDDGKSYLFALDPGTPNTSIDRNVAAATGLEVKPLTLPTGGGINTLTSTAVLGSSQLKLSGALFVVEDLRVYRSLYPWFAGILGANLLKQFRERFDFTAGKVEFSLVSDAVGGPTVTGAAKAIALTHDQGSYGVVATVDGHAAVFSLSTLYDSTLIHTSSLLSRLKPIAALGGLPAGDGTPVRFLRLDNLTVGDREWRNPVIEQPLAKGTPVMNILGLDFLHRYYLTLDLGHGQLYLDPDPAYRTDPHEWEGLGIVPAKTAQGKLIIAAIGDPSPARAAGLKIGDELTAIQGRPTAQLSQAQESALVKRPAGTPVELRVQSGGNTKPRTVYLKVKRLL